MDARNAQTKGKRQSPARVPAEVEGVIAKRGTMRTFKAGKQVDAVSTPKHYASTYPADGAHHTPSPSGKEWNSALAKTDVGRAGTSMEREVLYCLTHKMR